MGMDLYKVRWIYAGVSRHPEFFDLLEDICQQNDDGNFYIDLNEKEIVKELKNQCKTKELKETCAEFIKAVKKNGGDMSFNFG